MASRSGISQECVHACHNDSCPYNEYLDARHQNGKVCGDRALASASLERVAELKVSNCIVDIITKPVSLRALIEKIDRALD
jgi:hypothetical protein